MIEEKTGENVVWWISVTYRVVGLCNCVLISDAYARSYNDYSALLLHVAFFLVVSEPLWPCCVDETGCFLNHHVSSRQRL